MSKAVVIVDNDVDRNQINRVVDALKSINYSPAPSVSSSDVCVIILNDFDEESILDDLSGPLVRSIDEAKANGKELFIAVESGRDSISFLKLQFDDDNQEPGIYGEDGSQAHIHTFGTTSKPVKNAGSALNSASSFTEVRASNIASGQNSASSDKRLLLFF